MSCAEVVGAEVEAEFGEAASGVEGLGVSVGGELVRSSGTWGGRERLARVCLCEYWYLRIAMRSCS